MGYDMTCIISGFPNASSCNDVLMVRILSVPTSVTRQDYYAELRECIQRQDEADHPPAWNFQPTDEVAHAFAQYTAEDEDNRRDFVLIGPFDEHGNVLTRVSGSLSNSSWLIVPDIPQDPIAAMSLIQPLMDIVPSLLPSEAARGAFTSTRTSRTYHIHGEHPALLFVNASVLRILSLAVPSLTPPRLWALTMLVEGPNEQHSIDGVEYGPVWAGGMYVTLSQMEDDKEVDDWMIRFMRSGVVCEGGRREMMMGMGRQWVFVRPDRFPVVEAFTHRSQLPLIAASLHFSVLVPGLPSLPVDVLLHIASYLPLSSLRTFSTLSRSMLSSLGPFLDSLARLSMSRWEPWLLPPPGSPEMLWWEGQRSLIEYGCEFPWLGYARVCRMSASMKNRRRIWGIAEQLGAIVEEQGIIPV